MQREHSEKSFNCDECFKIFSFENRLKGHKKRVHSDKSFECEICRKTFSTQHFLLKHSKVHTDNKQYRCDICYKTFLMKGNLVIHMKVHNDEKPFQKYTPKKMHINVKYARQPLNIKHFLGNTKRSIYIRILSPINVKYA